MELSSPSDLANTAADSIYSGHGGANESNGLRGAVSGGTGQTTRSSQSNQASEAISGPNNGLWQSGSAERGGATSHRCLADMSVEQANGLPGNHEEEPARQASEGSYLDNASGLSYHPNGTVAGDDPPYPIREGVTCLPVQEQGSRLIAMSCFQSVGHVATHCPVSNAGRIALCYQQLMNVDWSPNLISSTGNIEREMENTCTDEEIRNWKQRLTRTKPQTAALKKSIAGGTFFIMEIGEVSQHRRYETPILSDAVYSYRFERLMGIRIYPNGVGSGRGTHVAIFIHLMESTFDDLLDWPYDGTITVSVLDRSGSRARSDISRIIQAKPNLLAFQQPHEAICRTGYGYVQFARIQEFFCPRYVKDDKLLVTIEFSR